MARTFVKTGSGVMWQTGQDHPRPKMQGIIRFKLDDPEFRTVLWKALNRGQDELVLELSAWKTGKPIGRTGKKGFSLSVGGEAQFRSKQKEQEQEPEDQEIEIPDEIAL